MRIVLGSQSPRRKKILNELGYSVEVLPSHFDEDVIRHENPAELTRLLAEAKNIELRSKVSGDPIIITADTVIAYNGKIYEKARSVDEAFAWITQFQNSTIEVVTSMMIYDTKTACVFTSTDSGKIAFESVPEGDRMLLAEQALHASVSGGFHFDDPLLRQYISYTSDESVIRGLSKSAVQSGVIACEKERVRVDIRALYITHDLNGYVASAIKSIELLQAFQSAQVVYAYVPLPKLEIPFVEKLINAHPEKKWIIVQQNNTNITRTDSSPNNEVVVLVPSLAATREGVRLGKGGGTYDTFLAKYPELKVQTITVLPHFAVVPMLPTEMHDVTIAHILDCIDSV